MVQELKDILTEKGLSDYIDLLESQHLDTEDLLSDLNQNDFKELGIALIGDQKKFLKLFSKKNNDVSIDVVPYQPYTTPAQYEQPRYNSNDNVEDPEKKPNIIIQNNTGSGSTGHGVLGGIIGAVIGVILAGAFIFWVLDNVLRHLLR